MVLLSSDEATKIRQECARAFPTVDYIKPQINAAIQGIEDWFEANRPSLSAAINTATGPFIFTNAQKVALVKYWLASKFERGG